MEKNNMATKTNWTHDNITITDIRKINKLYVITVTATAVAINRDVPKTPLLVSDKIFEDRLKSYFLKDDISQISRNDILGVYWNMYITKGYYIKVAEDGTVTKFEHDPNKWYVSYLEIAGPLGTFLNIYNDKQ